jgi:ABC-type Mn2+/Zn2+ transport system ATPase subunit
MTALIRFDHATLGYGRRVVLSDISFDIPAGDFLGLVGPNGAGKTTILRAILGSLAPMQGTVSMADGLRFGYVPQRDSVDYGFPLKVLDVVLMGRYDRIGLMRRPSRADRDLASDALEHVGVGHLADQQLNALSGGQKQRVLIARALVGQPNVLVLDEPTNGMDPGAELATMDLLRDLQVGTPLAIVMVSHRIEAVANYARTFAFVDKDEGLFRVGEVGDMLRPDALAALYRRPVEVREENGRRYVHAAGGEGGR